jgi:hypothetical protein
MDNKTNNLDYLNFHGDKAILSMIKNGKLIF